MLRTQKAKFAFNLLKSRWYKKSVNPQDINTLDDSSGVMINIGSESSVNFMCGVYNNGDDYLNNVNTIQSMEDPEKTIALYVPGTFTLRATSNQLLFKIIGRNCKSV